MAKQKNSGNCERNWNRKLRVNLLEDRTAPAAFADAGFDMPLLTAGTYQYRPTGTAWAFDQTAGVASNNSGFTIGNAAAPQGSQVAFIQSNGSLRQVVTFEAGTYTIGFSATQRGNVPSAQSLQVLVDGKVVGSFNNISGSTYSSQTTSSFNVTAGNHTITIQGTNLNGGDNTAFVDMLSINQLPSGLADSGFEFAMLGLGKYQYRPTGLPWSFNGSTGVSSNNSPFTSGNSLAPQGSQVLFVQGQGSVSQVVNFGLGYYTIGFRAAQRGNQPSAQTFQVLLDGNVVGTFNSITGTAYVAQSTSSFGASLGNHTITIQGTNINGGDNTIFIDQVTVTQQDTSLSDQGFELPVLATGVYRYNPTGSPWVFAGTSGVSSNNSGFTSGNSSAPQGSQIAYIQGKASFSQVTLFSNDTYAINFQAAQRGNQASAQTFQVMIDGVVVGTFNSVGGANYRKLSTSSFGVTAGSHTITFQGTNINGGDNTVFIDQVNIALQTTSLNDSGFESPAVAANSFKYNPTNTPWTFAGSSGVSANNSAFTSGNPAAPQGNQVVFLQRTSSVSQVVTFFETGNYAISFKAAQRGNQPSAQTMQVLVDGKVVSTFNTLIGTAYSPQTTATFNATAGSHTITIQGTNINGGDNTAFIDQVTVIQQNASLNDDGFETPALGTGAFQYAPSGSAWTYSGTAGISRNGSAFTSGNPNAPQGNQVLLLQRTGSASQTASFVAGSYSISLSAAQRGNQTSRQTFQILVDGNVVGTFNNLTGSVYSRLTTPAFSVSDGSHIITIRGTNIYGGDNTAFIDQVSVNSVS